MVTQNLATVLGTVGSSEFEPSLNRARFLREILCVSVDRSAIIKSNSTGKLDLMVNSSQSSSITKYLHRWDVIQMLECI